MAHPSHPAMIGMIGHLGSTHEDEGSGCCGHGEGPVKAPAIGHSGNGSRLAPILRLPIIVSRDLWAPHSVALSISTGPHTWIPRRVWSVNLASFAVSRPECRSSPDNTPTNCQILSTTSPLRALLFLL
jgi:hypothetical protein